MACDTPPRPSLFTDKCAEDTKLPRQQIASPGAHTPERLFRCWSSQQFVSLPGRVVKARRGLLRLDTAENYFTLARPGQALCSPSAAKRGIILSKWARLHDLGRK